MEHQSIWSLESFKPIRKISGFSSEKEFEDILVANPDWLIPGMKIVDRQTNLGGKFSDIIGVDSDGHLCIFELKNDSLYPEVFGQISMYGGFLYDLEIEELSELLSNEEIGDFVEWYEDNFHSNFEVLKNPRMFLVGFSVDSLTKKIVSMYSGRGMDISIIEFECFEVNGHRCISRKNNDVDDVQISTRQVHQRRTSNNEKEKWFDQKIDEYGYGEIVKSIDQVVNEVWGDVNPPYWVNWGKYGFPKTYRYRGKIFRVLPQINRKSFEFIFSPSRFQDLSCLEIFAEWFEENPALEYFFVNNPPFTNDELSENFVELVSEHGFHSPLRVRLNKNKFVETWESDKEFFRRILEDVANR